MEKPNQDISLAEFYQANQDRYPGGPISETLNNIISDFRNKYPKMFEQVRSTLIAVQSVGEVLDNLDFNWESKYKNHSFLAFYNQNEPINNLLDFYQVNKDYYDSLEIKYSDIISDLLHNWQEFSGATIINTGNFYNPVLNIERKMIFIKNNDLKDYLSNKEEFSHKVFGDKVSNVSMNFMYKNDDLNFSSENLQNIIKNHKNKKYGKR